MQYKLQGTTMNGKMALDVQYEFPPYKNWKVSHSTKYPVLLNNSGVCVTYSLAIEDLANKLGIPCRVVTGQTGMKHAWNIVLINGEVKHIDVAYAIMKRKFTNKKDFFLKSFEELIKYNGSRTITNSMNDLIDEMMNQYKQLHPQIKVISRTDIRTYPEITIINRTDTDEIKGMKR